MTVIHTSNKVDYIMTDGGYYQKYSTKMVNPIFHNGSWWLILELNAGGLEHHQFDFIWEVVEAANQHNRLYAGSWFELSVEDFENDD